MLIHKSNITLGGVVKVSPIFLLNFLQKFNVFYSVVKNKLCRQTSFSKARCVAAHIKKKY